MSIHCINTIMMSRIQLHADDNVALLLEPFGNIPAMHKVAVQSISKGQAIVKYGQIIGQASIEISAGDHVHTHNCEMPGERNAMVDNAANPAGVFVPADERATFRGFRRGDGRVGTRNYVGILTSVNCSATVSQQIAQQVTASGFLAEFQNVDGVVALTHGSGCGMHSKGEAFDLLKRTLDGYVNHPNFGGVLVVGLGCEVFQLENIVQRSGTRPEGQFRTLGIQESGGTRSAIESGVGIVRELVTEANRGERELVPASELVLALQCGGSDAYSAITANPALGVATDLAIQHGGSAILSETPEIYGAEHLLLARAASSRVRDSLLERIAWWEDYAAVNGGSLNSNPSPGNLAGGISTILEKSLGAQAKGGSTSLNAVLKYAERLTTSGLNFMDSPGYDPVSVTGQVASGANVVLFTTGRGSAFGFKPVPSIKLATNTALFERMSEDMDINCGSIATGDESLQDCGHRIFREILDVASGKMSSSEMLGYGDNEFTPWQLGGVY